MDYKFLKKVVDQIVSETKIDYRGRGKIFTPFFPLLPRLPLSLLFSSYRSNFSNHCEEIYGLNEEETDYVWKVYRGIIKDKISQ